MLREGLEMPFGQLFTLRLQQVERLPLQHGPFISAEDDAQQLTPAHHENGLEKKGLRVGFGSLRSLLEA